MSQKRKKEKKEREETQREIEKWLNEKIKVLGPEYKGRGRPQKSDYYFIGRRNLPDFREYTRLKSGFKTIYSK